MTGQQLKNSILQMAVQGKLVPQDPNDEPASVLLKRIRVEKEQLIKEGKIKKEKNPSLIFRGADNLPYEKIGRNEPVCIADEVPFEIPESWEWVRLGKIVYNRGQMKPIDDFCYIDIGSIDNKNQKLNDKELIITADKAPSRARKIVAIGDILYSTVRPYLHNMCIVNRTFSHQPIASTGFAALTCHTGFYNKFLFYYLMSPDFDAYANSTDNAKGVAYPAINDAKLYRALIPVPPEEEQKRIIKRLKKVLPYVDTYSTTYSETESLNNAFPDRIKKSILQEAVQGKLVPQNPSDEPASVLLERIRAEKQKLIAEGKIKKDKHESVIFRRDNSHYEKLDGIEHCIDDEIPFEIPETWEWIRLGSLFTINPRNNIADDTVVGFMPMPLLKDGFHSGHTYETKLWKDVKSGFTHFANNDVVIAKITPCFQNRKSAVIHDLPSGYGAGTTELHVLRDYTKMLYIPYFLMICKTHDFIQNGMKNFSGTAGQQRVGKDFIFNYLVPLPPVNEQKRIVEKVNVLIKSCDIL
jgi:type I restriction enzyme S subunit